MNRKDFELVARAIKSMKFLDVIQRQTVAFALADDLSKGRDCSGFDRVKFFQQCGIKP